MSFLAHVIWFLIKGFRPFLGSAICKYPVSCTAFAHQELQSKSLLIALKTITIRVLSCNPFTK